MYFVGRAGVRIREGDVEHGADAGGGLVGDQRLLQVRRQVVRHRDVDGRQQFDPLDGRDLRVLDLDRFIEVRLERLPHESIQADNAGVQVAVERRIEPRQY